MKHIKFFLVTIVTIYTLLMQGNYSTVSAGEFNSTAKESAMVIERCGTPDVDTNEAELIQRIVEKFLPHKKLFPDKGRRGWIENFPETGIVIPVAFHVIYNDFEGRLSETDIALQIFALNDAYEKTGVQFTLAHVDYTYNPEWFTMDHGSDEELEAKTMLGFDPHHYLNIYTIAKKDVSGLLGWSTFPWYMEDSPENDGVVILYTTLPGGAEEHYNEGDSLIHETGHWLGLFHTFQPKFVCIGRGDHVDDTPAERIPASGCPDYRNTCLLYPGSDPIHNYMDYAYDSCMNEFTPGQAERIQAMILTYRPDLLNSSTTTTRR